MQRVVFIAKKLREKGLVHCLKVAAIVAYDRIHKKAESTRLHLLRVMIRSTLTLPTLRFLLRDPHPDKRILAIWDHCAAPYSVGDVLILNELTMILRLIYKVDKVDVCLVCDSSNPELSRPYNIRSADDYHYHLSTILPVISVNPYLGSVHIFDSREHLEAFVIDNAGRYYVWPPFKEYLHKYPEANYNARFIDDFYRQNRFIPYLSCGESVIKWAYRFVKENVHPYLPVAVQLRNHPHCWERNARLDCWLEFFNFCNGKFDVKFILIGAREEIDDRFRGLANVIISKDFATTVVQDLALIQTALIFLGVSSGPNVMAIFSDIAYAIFNFRVGSEPIPHGSKPAFATSLQKLIWEPETSETLIKEFTELYSKVNIAEWEKKFEASQSRKEQLR